MSSNGGRTTLATIASVAGVSVATVSKVVNGRPDVAPTTRARVENLLAEHAYIARRVDPVRAPTVELLFHGRLTAYSIEIMHGVLDEASEIGLDVVVTRRPREERAIPAMSPSQWVRQLTAAGRRAVIAAASELSAGEVAALWRARLPIVVLDPINMPRARVTSIGCTNFTGGYTADPASARPGAPADRLHRRHPHRCVQPGPDVRVSRRDGGCRRTHREGVRAHR